MKTIKLQKEHVYKYQYSVCTLVTDLNEYNEMLASFVSSGFNTEDCEFIYADNTHSNEFDAFSAINRFLQQARGKYIIICHQDVLIDHDNRSVLEMQIGNINVLDPDWGVLGNAGASDLYSMSMVVTENGRLFRRGKVPSKVHSLDENFILVKAEANLAASANLQGFHLYGTDLCLIAECLGRTCYTIDFNITHKSSGRMNASFYEISGKLQRKYNKFFRGRYIKTPITRFYLGSPAIWAALMNLGITKNTVRLYFKLKSTIAKNE